MKPEPRAPILHPQSRPPAADPLAAAAPAGDPAILSGDAETPGEAPAPIDAGRPLLLFHPDYRATNPYQSGLYGEQLGLQASPGSLEDALLAQASVPERPVIWHLHWPEPLIGPVTSEEALLRRWQIQSRRIDLFQRLGGILVWTIHNVLPHERRFAEAFRQMHQELAARADLILLHSAEAIPAVQAAYPLPADRVRILPHGSYLGIYPQTLTAETARSGFGLAPENRVFAFVGQLRRYKGLDRLISAFVRLQRTAPKARLLIAGSPVHPIKPGYWLRVAEGRAGLRIDEGFVGDEDLQRWLLAADFLVFPYSDILTSGSVYLAASFGRPVILPRLPTLQEFHQAGFALGYDPDDGASLTASLAQAAAMPAAALAEMGAAALAFAENRRWGPIQRELGRMLQDLVGQAEQSRQVLGETLRITPAALAPEPGGIGIALVAYRSDDELLTLIASIPESVEDGPVILWVLDNGCDRAALARLQKLSPRITTVLPERNLGYAQGNNVLMALMQEAGLSHALILNPDTRVTRGMLEQLLATSREHPDALISPLVVNREGLVAFAGAWLRPEQPDLVLERRHLGQAPDAVPAQPYAADSLQGCSILVPLALIGRAGYIPTQYFLYFEETHWVLAARETAQIRCLIDPRARVIHYKQSQGARVPTLYYTYYLVRNSFLFNKAFGRPVEEAEARLHREFIEPWRERIRAREPSFLTIFDGAIRCALADGRKQRSGPVSLGDRIEKAFRGNEKPGRAGRVDRIQGKRISGQVVADAETPPVVWLIADGVPVLSVKAEHRLRGPGERRYTFSLTLPRDVADGRLRSLELRHAGLGLRLLFPDGAPVLTDRFLEELRPDAPPALSGRVNGVEKDAAVGWVQDTANPGAPALFDLAVNGRIWPGQVADLWKPDLAKAGINDGIAGFKLPLPADLLTLPELTVEIRAPGSGKLIHSRTVQMDHPERQSLEDPEPLEFLRWSYVNDPMSVRDWRLAARMQAWLKDLHACEIQRARLSPHRPLVSVVMPMFNREDCVLSAIDSVLAQSWQDWELIVVDDGSTDDSVGTVQALIDRLQDPRLHLIRLPANRGVSAARNAGLAAAGGEILAYLDSDNEWHPDFLLIMATRLAEDPQALCAYAGQELWQYLHLTGEEEQRTVRIIPFNRARLEVRNFIDLNVFLHRRAALERFGGFDEGLERLVDWDLILRYTAERPPLFIPLPLNRYYFERARNQITATVDVLPNRRRLLQRHGLLTQGSRG